VKTPLTLHTTKKEARLVRCKRKSIFEFIVHIIELFVAVPYIGPTAIFQNSFNKGIVVILVDAYGIYTASAQVQEVSPASSSEQQKSRLLPPNLQHV
jgi:hypothetical protein